MTMLTVPEVAQRLRVSDDLVYALCRSRKLTHNRVGARVIIPEDAVDAYLSATAIGPRPKMAPVSSYRGKHLT